MYFPTLQHLGCTQKSHAILQLRICSQENIYRVYLLGQQAARLIKKLPIVVSSIGNITSSHWYLIHSKHHALRGAASSLDFSICLVLGTWIKTWLGQRCWGTYFQTSVQRQIIAKYIWKAYIHKIKYLPSLNEWKKPVFHIFEGTFVSNFRCILDILGIPGSFWTHICYIIGLIDWNCIYK